MPAEKFTKKANTPKAKRQWEHVYESMKQDGKAPAQAIKGANAAVAKTKKKAK